MEQTIKSFTLLECKKIFGSEYPLLNKVITHLSTILDTNTLVNVIYNDRATDSFHIVLICKQYFKEHEIKDISFKIQTIYKSIIRKR